MPRGLGVCLAALVLWVSPATWAQSLSIRGVDKEPLRLRLDSAQLEHKLWVDESGNALADKTLLRVTDFKNEAGESIYPARLVTADDKELGEFPLEAMKSMPVRLKADIAASGTYSATLELLQGGKRLSSTEIIVTRPRSALNVQLDEVVARGDASLRDDQSQAHVQLVLREKDGQPVRLSPPTLTKLTLQSDGAGAVVFQTTARPEVQDDVGKPLAEPFVLEGRQTKRLWLVLSGLRGAGQYEGTVRLSSADAPPVETKFTLYMREDAWVAFVLILVGVFVSFGVRTFVTQERPRLMLQHRTLSLLQTLEALKASAERDARARELATVLQQFVTQASQGLSAFTVSVTSEQVDLLERKVSCARNWVRVRRSVEELRPESLQKGPLAKLDEVDRTLRAPGTTGAQLETAENTLAQLPSEMDAAVRQDLTGRIETFRAELTAMNAASANVPVTKDPFAASAALALARKMELKVKPLLDQAAAQVMTDPRAASESFDAARAAHATLLADELSGILSGPAPGFLSASEWSDLKAQVEVFLSGLRQAPTPTGNAAVAHYENGLSLYLRNMGLALFAAVGKQLQSLGEGQPQQRERLERVRSGADKSLSLLGERKFSEALRMLTEARREFTSASPAPATGGKMNLSAGASTPVSQAPTPQGASLMPEWLTSNVWLRMPQLEGRAPADGLAMVQKWLRTVDGLILLFMLMAASVAGHKVLWQDDPTWGGMNDRLLALLWGFGFHQVSYFAGFSAILERVLKATPPTAPVLAATPTPAPAPAPAQPPVR